jgi:hypothetical protein
MLDHQSTAMTLDVYAPLFENDLDALSDRLDAAISAAPAAQYVLRCSKDDRPKSRNAGLDKVKRFVGRAGLEPATGGL